MMTRRRFAFWLGMGLFWIARKLRAEAIDEFAATLMRRTEETDNIPSQPATLSTSSPERWWRAENNDWRWYQREIQTDGEWKRSGITTPINKTTGQPYTGKTGYLDPALVPEDVRIAHEPFEADELKFAADGPDEGQPNAVRAPTMDVRQASGYEVLMPMNSAFGSRRSKSRIPAWAA